MKQVMVNMTIGWGNLYYKLYKRAKWSHDQYRKYLHQDISISESSNMIKEDVIAKTFETERNTHFSLVHLLYQTCEHYNDILRNPNKISLGYTNCWSWFLKAYTLYIVFAIVLVMIYEPLNVKLIQMPG